LNLHNISHAETSAEQCAIYFENYPQITVPEIPVTPRAATNTYNLSAETLLSK
jgi:hypothetical protein